MKLIICFRHLKCICRKWCRGMDYSWHVQHLLREFGCGPLADLRSVSEWKETSREATVSVRVTVLRAPKRLALRRSKTVTRTTPVAWERVTTRLCSSPEWGSFCRLTKFYMEAKIVR